MTRLTSQEKEQLTILIAKGDDYNEVQKKLGRSISRSTFYRAQKEIEHSEIVGGSRNSNFIEDTESKLRRYFSVTFDDLVVSNSSNARELRDLMIIYNEYEIYFGSISENVKFSLQEKYQALVNRSADGVKVICDAIHFVSRRARNKMHAWKFEGDASRSAEEKSSVTLWPLLKR